MEISFEASVAARPRSNLEERLFRGLLGRVKFCKDANRSLLGEASIVENA